MHGRLPLRMQGLEQILEQLSLSLRQELSQTSVRRLEV